MISHATLGGKYKRRAHTNLRVVVWVSGTEWLGLSISHRPSTPAISMFLMAEYNQNELCTLFIHMHVPRPFGNFLVSMTLVV